MAEPKVFIFSSPDVVTESKLRDLAGELGPKWKDLASALGMKEAEIHHIKEDHKGQNKEVIFQMLLAWKRKNGIHATYDVLADALNSVQRNDLVFIAPNQMDLK